MILGQTHSWQPHPIQHQSGRGQLARSMLHMSFGMLPVLLAQRTRLDPQQHRHRRLPSSSTQRAGSLHEEELTEQSETRTSGPPSVYDCGLSGCFKKWQEISKFFRWKHPLSESVFLLSESFWHLNSASIFDISYFPFLVWTKILRFQQIVELSSTLNSMEFFLRKHKFSTFYIASLWFFLQQYQRHCFSLDG